MKFSVIIPTYNRSQRLVKTLQSIFEQIYTDFGIVVVDDGSTDDTRQVVSHLQTTYEKLQFC